MHKIEYLEDRVPINLEWKTFGPSNISHPSQYGFFPSEIMAEANRRIFSRVQELGQDGWEPMEQRTDIGWLHGRVEFIFESRGGLFSRRNRVDAVILKFKRTVDK